MTSLCIQLKKKKPTGDNFLKGTCIVFLLALECTLGLKRKLSVGTPEHHQPFKFERQLSAFGIFRAGILGPEGRFQPFSRISHF